MSASESNGRLFPLEFTPFESYYWCDDRPDYPTAFPVDLRFQGIVRRDVFRQSIDEAVARHPLLGALVEVSPRKLPRWVDSGGRRPAIVWNEGSSSNRLSNIQYIDLTSTPGLRVEVRCTDEASHVRLQFHHACCDALGAFRFVEDLLILYHCIDRGIDPGRLLRRVDPERLKVRGDFGLTDAGYRPNLPDAWRTLRLWLQILFGRFAALRPGRKPVAESKPTDDARFFLAHSVDSDSIAQLRRLAMRQSVTLNDLLLRDLFLTLFDWRTNRASRFRINLPVSLRQRADRWMPAANVLGFWFLTRDLRSDADREAQLRSISNETASVRKWRLPLYFIGGLGFSQRFPAIMRWVMQRKRSFATIVFSNTGTVLKKSPT